MDRFAEVSAKALSEVLGSKTISLAELEIPPDTALGDFAFPCFRLAKEQKKAPPKIAAELAEKLTKTNPKEFEVIATGPYINFKVKPQYVFPEILKDILKGESFGDYGKIVSKDSDNRGKWIFEFSSPNVAKPFNFYHLRTTVLGAALARIARFRGFDVTTLNHLGDWGTQYGKLAIAFQLFADELPPEPGIEDLVKIYVKFHKEVEKKPELEDQAREAFRKLETGDPELTAMWKRAVDISLKEFDRIYKRLHVEFDHVWGESYYQNLLKPLIEDMKARGLLVQSEGAWIVPLEDEKGRELTPCIIEKKDGATIYATRDLAAAIYRYEKFHFDRMSYIVGSEQKLHFQQLFLVLKKMGHEWYSKCEHIPSGLYRFKDSKMSTRKGNFVTLEDVISAAKERVIDLMKDRVSELKGCDLETIYESIAVGAVIFHDLKTDPARDVEFSVDRVVDFNGETGPYLQYAHTRCLSILKNAKASSELKTEQPEFNEKVLSTLIHPAELNLVKTLGRFPFYLERTLRYSKASHLASYLIDITKAFNGFYRECYVLGQKTELTQARLMLVESTRRILGQGLGLLGIDLPERM